MQIPDKYYTIKFSTPVNPFSDLNSSRIKYVVTAGISFDGTYYGYYFDENYVTHGFYANTNGSKFWNYDYPGSSKTIGSLSVIHYASVNYFDGKASIVGNYYDNNGLSHSYMAYGTYPPSAKNIDFPLGTYGTYSYGKTWISGDAANQSKEIVYGYYVGSDVKMHGFINDFINPTTFDYPGAKGTAITSVINSDKGPVYVGFFTDNNSAFHGFLKSADLLVDLNNIDTRFTTIIPTSINSKGIVVGACQDAVGWHGFALDSKGRFATYDYHGATTTSFTGIDDANNIVGVGIVGSESVNSFSTQLTLGL